MNINSSSSQGSGLPSILALVLGLPLFVLLITTPLPLELQVLFGMSGVVVLLILARIKSRWARLAMMLLSAMVSTRYLYWRVTETLVFDSYLDAIFGIGLFAAECYAWLILVLGFVQMAWPLERRITPLPEDSAQWPTVDIYVPTYNESLDIVRDTVLAAMNIDYPPDRMRIYILDDGKRPEFGAFASAVGVGYITRPDNSHAKAGNLNHAMGKTQGELICIFDCDHVATRAFLQATVGGFVRDDRLALVQTPHHFYSPDPFERNLVAGRDVPSEGELFYGPVQKGNDFWNAAFFCGSCAVIRRSALDEIGGFAVETVTEDSHTALKLQRKGWRTAFLGIPLAAGLATERLSLHIGQRARWARGMTQIFRLDNPLLGRGLTLPQRLCYLNAMLYFQFPLPRMVFLTAPLAYLLFDLNIIVSAPEMILAYALPHLFHAIYTNSRLVGRSRYTFWGEIYDTVLAFHLLKPTVGTLFSPRRGKFNVTEKGESLAEGFFDFTTARPHLFVLGLLVLGTLWGFLRMVWSDAFDLQNSVVLLNVVWASVSILALLAAIAVAREKRQLRQSVRIDIELPAVLHLASGHALSTTTRNLSMGGVMLNSPVADVPSPVECLEISFDDATLVFPVFPVSSKAGDTGLRFYFGDLPLQQRRELVGVVMGRADAWLPDRPQPQDRPLLSLWYVIRSVFGLFFHQWRDRRLAASGQRYDKSHDKSEPGTSSRSWLAPLALVTVLILGILLASQKAWSAPPYVQDAAGETIQQEPQLPPLDFSTEGRLKLPVPEGSSGINKRRIALTRPGEDGPVRLTGRGGRAGLNFSTRIDEVVTQAAMEISLSHAGAQLPPESRLIVELNGQPVHSIRLDQFNAAGVTEQVVLEPALVLPDNILEFRLQGISEQECATALASEAWVDIADSSHLNLEVQRLRRPSDLAAFPAPFFENGGDSHLNLVFGHKPEPAVIGGGAIVASLFGVLSHSGEFRFPVRTGQLSSGDAVAFATPETRIEGVSLPTIAGPMLVLRDNPKDPLYKLLLVLGRTPEEVQVAAHFLALRSDSLDGTAVQATRLTSPTRQPYDAPSWVDNQAPVLLGELAEPSSLKAEGVFPGVNRVNFRAPPDLFLWPGRSFEMRVDYRFPDVEWLDERQSRLDVEFNEQFLASLPVVSGGTMAKLWQRLVGERVEQSAKVPLPADLLYGNNRLEFYYNLVVKEGADCMADGEQVIGRIAPDSYLDFSEAQHFATLPELAYFINSGFPFTRLADLSETTALVPKDVSDGALSALFGLVGRMSAATGYPALGLEVHQDVGLSSAPVGRDLLMVAELGAVADSRLLKASPFRVIGKRLGVAEVAPIDRWRYWRMGNLWPSWSKPRQALEDAEIFQGLVSFVSPVDEERVVVAILANEADRLSDMVASLARPEIGAKIRGDLAILGSDTEPKAFSVGPKTVVGEVPWHMELRWYFGRNVLLMVVALLLTVVLCASALYFVLKRRAAYRLSSSVDTFDE